MKAINWENYKKQKKKRLKYKNVKIRNWKINHKIKFNQNIEIINNKKI